jgi:agmatinase
MNEADYAGINTFFEAPQQDLSNLDSELDIVALGAPFDGGVTNKPGARYGPEELRKATARTSRELNTDDQMYSFATGRTASYSALEIRDCGDITVVPNDIRETHQHVRGSFEQIPGDVLPILLGGDHSLTHPAFCGLADTLDTDVGVLQIDAHTDTWGTDDLYGDYYHGAPMSHIADSLHGGYEQHAVVGVRGHTDEGFLELVEEEDLHVETTSDVESKGIEQCIEGAMGSILEHVDHVYVTVDIDVVDPAFAPGTGTPVPGGLDSTGFLRGADQIGTYDEVCCLDLMEVAPRLDPTDMTSLLGARFISRFLQAHFYEAVSSST